MAGRIEIIERLGDVVAVAEGGLAQFGRGSEAGPEVIWVRIGGGYVEMGMGKRLRLGGDGETG